MAFSRARGIIAASHYKKKKTYERSLNSASDKSGLAHATSLLNPRGKLLGCILFEDFYAKRRCVVSASKKKKIRLRCKHILKVYVPGQTDTGMLNYNIEMSGTIPIPHSAFVRPWTHLNPPTGNVYAGATLRSGLQNSTACNPTTETKCARTKK